MFQALITGYPPPHLLRNDIHFCEITSCLLSHIPPSDFLSRCSTACHIWEEYLAEWSVRVIHSELSCCQTNTGVFFSRRSICTTTDIHNTWIWSCVSRGGFHVKCCCCVFFSATMFITLQRRLKYRHECKSRDCGRVCFSCSLSAENFSYSVVYLCSTF